MWYGANWGSEPWNIQFWDDLDYIGVDGERFGSARVAHIPGAVTFHSCLVQPTTRWRPVQILATQATLRCIGNQLMRI